MIHYGSCGSWVIYKGQRPRVHPVGRALLSFKAVSAMRPECPRILSIEGILVVLPCGLLFVRYPVGTIGVLAEHDPGVFAVK
jgi:hypothetical protein